MNKAICFCSFSIYLWLCVLSFPVFAADIGSLATEVPIYHTYLPNRAGKTLMTPTGWGASNNVVFFGAGGTAPQAYSSSADGAISMGIGLLDPVKIVGLQASMTVSDLSEMDNFSFGFKLHRYLGYGISVAVGGENLFHSNESDANESFYFVLSRASQNHINPTNGISRLHINLGAGSGRFGKKSELDKVHSKGEHGSYVFAAAAYEFLPSTNAILEWSGVNLNAGFSTAPFKKIPMVLTLGAADLTSYSGNKVRLIGTIGFSYQF